MGEVGNFEMER